MTKTKRQLREEAVERLKYAWNACIQDTRQLFGAAIGKEGAPIYANREDLDALIDLLTDDANDDSAPEKVVSGESADVTTEKRTKAEHDGVEPHSNLLEPDSREKSGKAVFVDGVQVFPPKALEHMADSREKLEAEMAEYLERDWYMLAPGLLEKMSGWLDRQAEITYHEIVDRWAEHLHPIEQRSADLTAKVSELERAYHCACHERDELRETLSRLLGLCDEMQRVASFYGQSVPYGAPDGCDEGLA